MKDWTHMDMARARRPGGPTGAEGNIGVHEKAD